MIATNSKTLPLCVAIVAAACEPAVVEYSPDPAEAEEAGDEAGEAGEAGDPPDDAGDLPDDPECEPLPGATALAVGGGFSCALQSCGEVVCWGANRFGQLGQGHVEPLGDDELPNAAGPIALGGPAASIVAGGDHACALRTDGQLLCWGHSWGGALGYGDLNIVGNNELPAEIGAVDLGQPIRSVHAGFGWTCAITLDRELLCWGYNALGQLGYAHTESIGDDEAPSSAGTIDVGGSVLDVALSASNICALLEGGEVRCWGSPGATLGAGYDVGEIIGDDEAPSSLAPVALGGPAQAIEAGFYHVCALLESGDLVCWGGGGQGQLGHGNFESIGDDETPEAAGPVPLGEPVTAVALGSQHSCAIGESGRVRCWGKGDHGRLGYPEVMGSIGGELRPVDVGPIELPGEVDELGAGSSHTCARIGPDVYCWGAGWDGALGYGEVESLGDDEPPASGGPVQFAGGVGNGGVELTPDEFDQQPDATLFLTSQANQPPAELAVGQTLHIRGSEWMAFECEDCTNSMVIRAADDQTIVIAQISEFEALHPDRGILNMLGLDPSSWLGPLELELVPLDLCDPVMSPHAGCFGTRLVLEVDYPNSGAARLLDGGRGLVGGGYMVSVSVLQDWSDACFTNDETSRRSLVAIRQGCAPNCGPIDVVESCEPAAVQLDAAHLAFSQAKQPLDPGYDLTCEVLSQAPEGPQNWRIELDCVGLR
ncbi:MAG: hypothetical protein R6X02_20620 [Enhygromyxa sp.]